MRRLLLCALGLLLAAAPCGAAAADTLPPLAATPPAIAINSLYNGMDLTVAGKIPAGSQVVVRLAGEPTTFHMKEKGKVFGILWMNREKVAFSDAPKVFLEAASEGVAPETAARYGVPGLAERIKAETPDPDKAALIAEFLKYQQAEKLYRDSAGVVTLAPEADGQTPFSAVLHVPSRLSPGTYSVEALALKDGAVVARGQTAIAASFVGAPAFLADMAFGHATLYGVLASIIAILGGLVISRIFQGSKSGAH